MTNAEILADLDSIMAELTHDGFSELVARLATIRAAIARKPADPPSPFSGGGPPDR